MTLKSQKRTPQYFRQKNKFRIRNFKNYLPLLEKIGECRFSNSAHLVALNRDNANRTNTLVNLQKLFHNGFVNRVFIPTTKYRQGSNKIVYTLTKKGVELLVEEYPERFKEIYYPQKWPSYLFVGHELMITNFRVCLTLALKNREKIELMTWKQGKSLEAKMKNYQVKGQAIFPDGYFAIRIIDPLSGEKKELHYFLEADRGTMKLAKFYDKIRRYRRFFSQASGNRQKLPAIFFVVTVATSETRTKNLRIITIQGDPHKQGSPRFLFSSNTQFSIEEPEKILKPIFRVGVKGEEKKSMSLLIGEGR